MFSRLLNWLFGSPTPNPAPTPSVAAAPARGAWDSFDAKVTGVTHNNDCGGRRQAIIARCRVGEPLRLEREPNNPVDKLAIKVLRSNGEQIGYIPADEARLLSNLLDRGFTVRCFISGLTGATNFGVNLVGWIWSGTGAPPDGPRVEIQPAAGSRGRQMMSPAQLRAVKAALHALRDERINYFYCVEDDTFLWHIGPRGAWQRDDSGEHLRALVAAKSSDEIGCLAVEYYKSFCRNSFITAAIKMERLSQPPPTKPEKRKRRRSMAAGQGEG